jgi:hypothetical protein
MTDKSTWLSSHDLAEALGSTRDNDVKVDIDGILVPVAGVRYDHNADAVVITLVAGENLAVALSPPIGQDTRFQATVEPE